MASSGPDVPFAISQHAEGLKLVELPSQLLDQIKSKHSPTLFLKSATTGLTDNESAPSTVLCTETTTYIVRQVQSSNSVFVLQPSAASSDEDDLPSSRVTAISRCTNTLELVASSPSPHASLRRLLPIFDVDTFQDSGSRDHSLREANQTTKELIECDVPCSRKEFEAAWADLCAFEHDGQAWRPSSRSCLALWKSLLVAADLQSHKLDNGINREHLHDILCEDGFPPTLVDAVVRLLDPSRMGDHDGLIHFSREKCLLWVAQLLLDQWETSSSYKDGNSFIRNWRDTLPDSWRVDAQTKLLQAEPAFGCLFNTDGTKDGESRFMAAESARGGSRRWHEKFKASRKQ